MHGSLNFHQLVLRRISLVFCAPCSRCKQHWGWWSTRVLAPLLSFDPLLLNQFRFSSPTGASAGGSWCCAALRSGHFGRYSCGNCLVASIFQVQNIISPRHGSGSPTRRRHATHSYHLPLWSLPNTLVPKQRVKPGLMLLRKCMLNVWYLSFLWRQQWRFCWKFFRRSCHEWRRIPQASSRPSSMSLFISRLTFALAT
jgi:hypothetical protein